MGKNNNELIRCAWNSFEDPLYRKYHDDEWGVPVYDDRKIFEFLVLESAQAGLSWSTVLRKRENYREAFAGFDPIKVAKFTKGKVTKLLGNAGIIRNRLKIEAAIIDLLLTNRNDKSPSIVGVEGWRFVIGKGKVNNNAQRFLDIQKEFGTFSKYIWGFVGGKPIRNHWQSIKQLPVITPAAEALAKDLKKRGFKFLGPTVLYAHMQATGMVNDHTIDCFRYKPGFCSAKSAQAPRPGSAD